MWVGAWVRVRVCVRLAIHTVFYLIKRLIQYFVLLNDCDKNRKRRGGDWCFFYFYFCICFMVLCTIQSGVFNHASV